MLNIYMYIYIHMYVYMNEPAATAGADVRAS